VSRPEETPWSPETSYGILPILGFPSYFKHAYIYIIYDVAYIQRGRDKERQTEREREK